MVVGSSIIKAAAALPQQQAILPATQPSRQVSFGTDGAEPKRVGRRHSEFSMITAQQQSLQPQPLTSGGVVNDLAAKYAHLLSMSKEEFLALSPAEPVRIIEEQPQYTYQELLRIVYRKDYGSLKQNELETYLCDEEFEKVFVGKNKVQFYVFKKKRG